MIPVQRRAKQRKQQAQRPANVSGVGRQRVGQALEGKERGNYMSKLLKDNNNPLLNRATLGAYPPGSTFKPTQALTFLQEHVITPNTYYPCQRGFRVKGMKVGCHTHQSPIELTNAISTSCNGYFCWGLYHMFNNRSQYKNLNEAMTRWKNYMVKMGFGYRLGIDLPSEGRGLIPNAQFYDDAYKGNWNALSVISISIGQGEVLATPLQIANLGATIANRGKYKIPHVVHSIQNGQVADSLKTFRSTEVSPYYYDYVIKGMRGAVQHGTCTGANIPGYDVCGKTGTAQNPHGKDHSAFMGFAPMSDPKIAICVYVENGEWGATYGVPIGALMMEQYLRGKLSPAAEEMANRFEHKTIDYNEKDDKKKKEQKKEKQPEVKKDTTDSSRVSVFHQFGTYQDSIAEKVKEINEEKRRRQQEQKEAMDRKQAEEMRIKEEKAREKAEIRQKAEIARRKVAEMRRKEDEEKERRRQTLKQRQKNAMDKAIQTDWIIRQMKKKIEQ